MYAVMMHVTLKDGRESEAVEALHSDIVPSMKGVPGFAGGHWARNGNKGFSVELFDTEEQAKAVVAQRSAEPPPAEAPVSFDSIEVYEVLASA